MKKTQILLADDHAIIRNGLRLLLENEWGWEICGEAANGREAVEQAEKLQPDIVVLDIGMPEVNGLDATRQIRQACPETEILIFSSHESDELVREVFAAGARGYLLKTDAPQHLVAAIKALLEKKPYFTAKISEVVFAGFLNGAPAEDTDGRLSPRERETVQLLCEGSTNKEVGSKLGISVKTVETHRKNIMAKLGMKSFSHLVAYAIRNQIIQG